MNLSIATEEELKLRKFISTIFNYMERDLGFPIPKDLIIILPWYEQNFKTATHLLGFKLLKGLTFDYTFLIALPQENLKYTKILKSFQDNMSLCGYLYE
jgi:hypothetical protein